MKWFFVLLLMIASMAVVGKSKKKQEVIMRSDQPGVLATPKPSPTGRLRVQDKTQSGGTSAPGTRNVPGKTPPSPTSNGNIFGTGGKPITAD